MGRTGVSVVMDRIVIESLDRIAAAHRWSRAQVIRLAAERYAAEHDHNGAERIEVRA